MLRIYLSRQKDWTSDAKDQIVSVFSNVTFVRDGEAEFIVIPDHLKEASTTGRATGGMVMHLSYFLQLLSKLRFALDKTPSTTYSEKKSSSKKKQSKSSSAKSSVTEQKQIPPNHILMAGDKFADWSPYKHMYDAQEKLQEIFGTQSIFVKEDNPRIDYIIIPNDKDQKTPRLKKLARSMPDNELLTIKELLKYYANN